MPGGKKDNPSMNNPSKNSGMKMGGAMSKDSLVHGGKKVLLDSSMPSSKPMMGSGVKPMPGHIGKDK
jgi:hypothetical protein